MVNDTEFARLKNRQERHIVMTELALGGTETAIAFAPQEEWPAMFRRLDLYKVRCPSCSTVCTDAAGTADVRRP